MIEDGSYDLKLTFDNIKFPRHFCCFGDDDEAKHLSNSEIEDMIRNTYKLLKKENESSMILTATGNTIVLVSKDEEEEEYYVVVAKGYYDTFIPFRDIEKQEMHSRGD